MPGISSRLLKDLAAAGFHASEYRVLLFCASGEQSQEAIMKELGMKQPNVYAYKRFQTVHCPVL